MPRPATAWPRLSWRLSSWLPHRRRRLLADVAAWALGLLLLVWSLLPTYNMLLIALDEEGDTEYAGIVWPAEATLDAFRVVLTGDYWYLQHFWLKFANSLFIALATMLLITLAIGSLAGLRARPHEAGARLVARQFPGSHLCRPGVLPGDPVLPHHARVRPVGFPMGGDRRRRDLHHALRHPDPAAIREAHSHGTRRGGANRRRGPWQIYRRLYLPLTAPALAAVGTFALLFAWNEYIYQYILLTSERKMTVPVAIAQFFDADEAPWNYMMATAILYALPPVVIFFALRRWMLAGLTLGGVRR